MRIDRFEEIIAWRKAIELNLLIYKIFDKSRDYRLKEQIQHVSFSIYKPLTLELYELYELYELKIERFEQIIAWRKAIELNLLIYKIFDKSRDYRLKEQIQRAYVSIYKFYKLSTL